MTSVCCKEGCLTTQDGRLFTKLYYTAHVHEIVAGEGQRSLRNSDRHAQRLFRATAQAAIFGTPAQLPPERRRKYRWGYNGPDINLRWATIRTGNGMKKRPQNAPATSLHRDPVTTNTQGRIS